ncbi:MAG: hypothetical protein K0S26_2979 [Bacteroidota bacterium]|nr:hypothetical protein [Bacteroidota bacterium]
MKLLYLVVLLIVNQIMFSQNEFDVGLIKPELKNNADAVIRIHDQVIEINDIENKKSKEHLVVTVFNEKGEDLYSSFSRYYDKFNKIKKLEGSIYDSSGKKIKTLKNSDIKDYSNFDATNEVTDNRQKVAFFDKKQYAFPYTIDFYCVEENSNGMFFPIWNPISNEHIGIEKTRFTIICPSTISFRYKEKNTITKASITHEKDDDIYAWSIENILPMEFECYMADDQLPVVYTSPTNFVIDSYVGSALTWHDLGKFYYMLNKNRDAIPESTKQKIEELIRTETDTVKIIETLYKYMQSTTRYISIQLGIGGWQTMKAMDVAQKGYGDCKALSNYMIALLKQAGIKALPVLNYAGSANNIIQEDFPGNFFNHVIVCVPMATDTIWLECTSQTNAMGFLGSFTGNRQVLVIDSTGGKLVNGIFYHSNDNTRARIILVDVKESGSANAVIKTSCRGIEQEYLNYIINNLAKEKQKESIIKKMKIPDFELKNFSFKESSERIPKIDEIIEISMKNVVPKNRITFFINPNLLSGFIATPLFDPKRKSSFYLNPGDFNFNVSDSVIYNFEQEIKLESLPSAVTIQSKFGSYSINFIYKNNQLIYYRNLMVTGGYFPGSDYTAWVDFVKQINKNDKQKVAFSLIK